MTTAERIARARNRDEGFTLIEVMVAMVIFAIVASAAAAMLVGGSKAGLVTRMDTGAKELGQQQLESMRNLLHQPDGGSDSSAVELLKVYFPSYASTSVACRTNGFVASGATRCTSDGDPATGAFYRTVIDPVPDFERYTQYVTLQFLNDSRQPITLDSSYTPATPPSGFLSATVQTVWTVGEMSKHFQLSAYIPTTSPASPVASLAAHAVALELSGDLDSTRTATLGVGLVDIAGSITLGAAASASAQGGYATISGGSRVDGSTKVVSVPPSDSGAPYAYTDTASLALVDGADTVASVNRPAYSGVGASTTSALPVIASSTSPVKGYIPSQGSGQQDITFTNNASPASRLGIVDGPLAYVTQGATADPVPAASSTTAAARGAGYAATTATSGATRHSVSATVGAATQTIHLLPTAFAPAGLVQIRLVDASLTCQTDGLNSSSLKDSVSYTAYVSFYEDASKTNWQYSGGTWTQSTTPGTAGYIPYLTLGSTKTTDALRTAPLTQIQVGTDDSGAPLMLSDYIESWQSLTATESTAVGEVDSTMAVQANVPSVLAIATQPMRDNDAESGMSLTLAKFSCTAGDTRS